LVGEEKKGYFDGMKSLGFNFFNLSYHAIKTSYSNKFVL